MTSEAAPGSRTQPLRGISTREDTRPPSQWPPRIVLDVAIVVIALLLLMVLVGDQLDRPPFPLQRMELLTEGMSQAEVQAVLGEPSSRSPDGWTYSGFLSWGHVYVLFDDDGRYRAWRFHDD